MISNDNSLEGLSLDAEGVEFPRAEVRGKLVRINGKTMIEQGVEAGTELVIAKFEKASESKKYPGQTDYFFRGAQDSLIILRGNASVKRQMASISEGELTRIVYEGTYTTPKAPGKVCHGFLIEGALSSKED